MSAFLLQEAERRGAAPAAQPMAPAAQPMAPAAQPMAPAAQPMAPAAQPMAPAAQPMAPAAQTPFMLQEVTRREGMREETSPLRPPLPTTVGGKGTYWGTGLGMEIPPNQGLAKAAERGVIFDMPAPAGHFAASFALNKTEEEKAFRLALSDRYGEQTRVRRNAETGDLEYYIPEERRFSLVDPPTIGVEDLEGMGGPAAVLVPELTFGLAAAMSSRSPTVTALGAGAGAFFGEAIRLGIGYQLGINQELTTEQAAKEALKVGGLTAGLGIAADKALALGKFVFDLAAGNAVPRSVRDSLDLGAQDVEVLTDRINSVNAQIKLRYNMAQASNEPDQLMLQRALENDPRYRTQFGEFKQEQADALAEFHHTINKPFSTRSDLAATEEAVRSMAQSGVDALRTKADIPVDMQRAKLARMVNSLDDRPYSTFGDDIREVGSAEQAEFREWAKTAVRNLNGSMGDTAFIQNTNANSALAQLQVEARHALLAPMRAAKNRMALQGADEPTTGAMHILGENGEVLSIVYPDEAKSIHKLFTPGARLTFEETWGTLSWLKSEVRRLSSGMATDSDLAGQAKMIQSALERDLDASLDSATGGATMRQAYDDFRYAYAAEKQRLDEGVVGKVMRRSGGPNSPFVVADESVFRTVFRPGDKRSALQLRALINNDPEALKGMRESIHDFYKEIVVDPDTLRANSARHDHFIKRYAAPLGVFFNKQELKQLDSVGGMEKALRAKEVARQKTLEAINRTFNADLATLRPGELVNFVMDPKNPAKARMTAEVLKRSPEILRGVQAELVKQVHSRSLGGFSPQGRKLSAERLDTFLYGTKKQVGHLDVLRNFLGKQYADDMETLSQALTVAARKADRPANMANEDWQILKNLSRAYVGVFTTEGRFLTAVDKIRAKAAERMLAKAMLNPGDLRKLVASQGVDVRTRDGVTLLGAFGASALTLSDDGPAPASAPYGVTEE